MRDLHDLNFIDEDNPYTLHTVKRFGVILVLFSGIALLLVAFTPAGMYILTKWIGATPATGKMAMDVLRFMCLLPNPTVIGAIGMVAAESGEIIYLYYNLKKANTLPTAGVAPSVQDIIERNH